MDGERLWSEKINEGNSIAPYLRQTPPPSSKSLIYTYKHRQTHWVRQVEALSHMSGPTEHHPWGGSSEQTAYFLLQKHLQTTHLAV